MSYIETSNLDGETNLKIRQVMFAVVCFFASLLLEIFYMPITVPLDYKTSLEFVFS